MSLLDRPAAGAPASAPRPGPWASLPALATLSSATLAVGSAAAFLVLATLLSFVPEGGRGADDRGAGLLAESTSPDRLAGRFPAWSLRGSLPPAATPAALVPPRERMAQRAPS